MTEFTETLKLSGEECVGVIGTGHLGSALAEALLASGLPKSRLLLCHGGSPATYSRLASLGLAESVVGCSEIGPRCGIVIVALRPQDADALAACSLRSDAAVVSCMAGVSVSQLPVSGRINQRSRLMPSPPRTIAQKNGIAGVFPKGKSAAREVCTAISLEPFDVNDEDDFHAFTALGVCLPTALSYWISLGNAVDTNEIRDLAAESGLRRYDRVLEWAMSDGIMADAVADSEHLLSSAATRGGVTQAILEAIRSGQTLADGLRAGIRRSKELQADRS